MPDESTAEPATSTATLEAPSAPTQTATPTDAGTASAQANTATSAPPTATPGIPGSSSATPERSAADLLKEATRATSATSTPIPPPPAAPVAAPVEDFQRKFQEAQTYIGRMSNELGAMRKQAQAYEGLPPADTLRQQLAQQQASAQAAKLTPYHKAHQDHFPTMRAADRWSAFQAALKNAHPDNANDNAWVNRLGKDMGVSLKDKEAFDGRETHYSNVRERLATDPDGWHDEQFDRKFAAAMAQRDQYQGVRAQTEQFLTQNHKAVEANRDLFVQGLDENVPRAALVMEIIKAREEAAALRSGVTQNVQQVETAKAQIEAAKGRSTVRRDAAPTNPVDVNKVIKDRNLEIPKNSNQSVELYKLMLGQ